MKKIHFVKNILFVGVAVFAVFLLGLSFDSSGQEHVQLDLEITNSFAASGEFVTGMMVNVGNTRYSNNLVQLKLVSNSGSQYKITGDVSPFVSGSGLNSYVLQENIYLTGNDGLKNIYLQYFRDWSGGYYIEKLDVIPFEVFLDSEAPSKVILLNPGDTQTVDSVVHFQWSASVDTGVGFLEYTYSFSSDPSFASIDYAGTTTDNGVILNVNSILGEGTFYWKVSSEDKLGNFVDSEVFSFVVGDASVVVDPTPTGGSSINPGYTIPFDSCPDGDYSSSYYDDDCGSKEDGEKVDYVHGGFQIEDEFTRAYDYAFKHGITTTFPYEEANLTGQLLRKHLAKMMSQFAVNVMGMEPNINTGCVFDDIDDISEEFQYYTVLSCQLGIMGLTYDGYPAPSFNPNELVKRSHFATTLSRLIFGGAFNGNSKNRYADHMHALKRASIMSYISNPQMKELRGYVFLMLMRTDENGFIEVGNISGF